jgi:hypothetical protein
MIIKVCICSFIIIILLHYLYNFLLATLTVPKVKDLVIKPQKQYENILRFEESIHADAERRSRADAEGRSRADAERRSRADAEGRSRADAEGRSHVTMTDAPRADADTDAEATTVMRDELMLFIKERNADK